MESRIPIEILGLFRWVTFDSDLVISSISCLAGRGGGCGVVRFLAEDGSRNLDPEFLSNSPVWYRYALAEYDRAGALSALPWRGKSSQNPLPGLPRTRGFHHADPAPRQLPGVLPDARGLDRGELPLGVRSVYTWRPERVSGMPEMWWKCGDRRRVYVPARSAIRGRLCRIRQRGPLGDSVLPSLRGAVCRAGLYPRTGG